MRTLIQKIKHVVLMKYEFDHRDKSKCFLWNLRISGNWCKGEKKWISSWILVYRSFVFVWDFHVGNQTGVGWELEVWISSEIKRDSTFEIIGLSQIQCTDQNGKFAKVIVLRKQNVFNGDFSWRNDTCGYWERWVWLSKQINKIKLLLIFLTVGLWGKEQKNWFFN